MVSTASRSPAAFAASIRAAGRARSDAVIQAAARRIRHEAPLARELWALAWPAITHMLLVTLVFVAGRVMVGRHASADLAALQISGTLTWSAYAVFTAFSAGALAVVARSVGAGDHASAARAARTALLLALLVGLVVAVPIRVANGALLRLLFPKADPSVIAGASAYLHIVLPVLPLAFVEAIAAACLQGAGDTRTPLYVASAGNLVNFAAGFVLIFGRFGAPELGIRGAAAGNAATMAIEGIFLAAALLRRTSLLPLRTTPFDRALDRDALRRVLRVSVPAFAEKGVYHAGYTAFIAIVGLLGSLAMAADQALLAIEAICFLSADGFGIAAGAVVAQKLGAGRPAEAARAGAIASLMAIALLSTVGVIFLLAPRPLVAVFSSDPALVEMGAAALIIAAFAQPFMAYADVTGMALRGAGDTRTVLASTIACTLVVRLAATWLFAITLGLGLPGVWMGSTADWIARTVVLAVAYRRGKWRTIRV